MTRLDVIKEALKHGGLSGVALLESLHQNGFAMDYLEMSVYADDTESLSLIQIKTYGS